MRIRTAITLECAPIRVETKFFGDEDRAAGLCLLISAIVFVLPYFLRLWTKRQNAKAWKRASLGLGPVE